MDQIAIQQMIDNEIEESLIIEYKAAKSLGRKDSEKLEITKDVSAMANSAGGRIYYGVAEYDEPEKKHLPEKIDPIDRTQFSREWLEQVINTIRPKINDLIIKSISIDMGPNHVVYVVDIPQSRTAHQAKDYRYYKRHNFISVPMEDYEIRDVMGRNKYPNVILDFLINNENFLEISAQNYGEIYAKYVHCLINIPTILLSEDEKFWSSPQRVIINDIEYFQIYTDNKATKRKTGGGMLGGGSTPALDIPIPGLYEPILPYMSIRLKKLKLREDCDNIEIGNLTIDWHVNADNAPRNPGSMPVSKILPNQFHQNNQQ